MKTKSSIFHHLGLLCAKYPDQRVGQIMSNLVQTRSDLFYSPDEDILKEMKRVVKDGW